MKLIVNADDFGLTRGVNLGIIEAFQQGIVRSTTLMVGMPAECHAAELASQNPGLKVGIHLRLTAGTPMSDNVSSLLDQTGKLQNQSQFWDNQTMNLEEIEREGGWGFPISDHGSGASLGLAAVRYSLLAHEGMKTETPLSKAIMATFENSPENAVAWQDSALPRDYGSYGPMVVEHLSKGDHLAEQLIRESAEDAAMMIRVLNQRGADQCAQVGGLSEFVMPWLPEDVASIATLPQGDAMHGALLMAAKLV